MKLPLFLVGLAAVCLGTMTAQAQMYGVHFLGSTTDPVTGTAGVVPIGGWNNLTQAAASFPITASNGLNPATLTLSGPGAANGYRTVAANGDGGNSSLMHGYLDSGGNGGQAATGTGASTVTLTLTGLAGTGYNVYIYDMADANRPGNIGDGLPDYTVNGTSYFTPILGGAFTGFVLGQTQSTELSAFPTTLTAGNYIVIPNVAPVGGTITITTNADNRTFRSPLDGFELVAVPEPSTVTFGVVGLLGAFFVAMRRRLVSAE